MNILCNSNRLHFECSLQAQRRGATRFLSSPDELSEWDSFKTAGSSISRADVISVDGTSLVRRARYRTTTEKTTTTPTASSSGDSNLELKTAGKVPVYRVRGRSRNKQDTENEKNLPDAATTTTTTAKSTGSESNYRAARRKAYQSNTKPLAITRNENRSIETNKDTVSSTHHANISSRKSHSETGAKSTTESPVNHQPENHRKTYGDVAATRKTPTGRRYRIRVVDANSINANGQTADSEKKMTSTTMANELGTTTTKAKKTIGEPVDDELNYPEHFKALLKSKKSTIAPSSASSRTNNFLSKKLTTTTVAQNETTTTSRPVYKHKKIERPNLKLLFPSLHTSTTTTESTSSVTAIESDHMATDELNTETNEPSDGSSTTAQIKTTVQKQIGGLKFSSKIRAENDDPTSLSAFRSRSTPLVFDTLKSSTQRIPNKPDTPPHNHRFSSVSYQFLFFFVLKGIEE